MLQVLSQEFVTIRGHREEQPKRQAAVLANCSTLPADKMLLLKHSFILIAGKLVTAVQLRSCQEKAMLPHVTGMSRVAAQDATVSIMLSGALLHEQWHVLVTTGNRSATLYNHCYCCCSTVHCISIYMFLCM